MEKSDKTRKLIIGSGTNCGRTACNNTPSEALVVTPSVLRLNQNIKPCHEHHVYVLLHVVNEKLNFIALILKLSSNLFLVQVVLPARHLPPRESSIATKSNDKLLSFTNY